MTAAYLSPSFPFHKRNDEYMTNTLNILMRSEFLKIERSYMQKNTGFRKQQESIS